jgi:hypothetical protein
VANVDAGLAALLPVGSEVLRMMAQAYRNTCDCTSSRSSPGPRSMCAGAAENFLIHLHGYERFTLVGQPTNGGSGQPLMLDLPGGGRAWIRTNRNTYPDGRIYVGTGIVPDVAVPVTADDVCALAATPPWKSRSPSCASGCFRRDEP